MGKFKYKIIKNRTTMKQLLILFALFPVFLIGHNLPETIPAYNQAIQDSIRKWEKDYRVYQGHTLPVDPAKSKPIWKYSDLSNRPMDKRKFQIKGEHPIRITDLDNGMIRIEKRESEAEFWKRKYHELLKSHLELIERQ